MKYLIDQSGKIENTGVVTVLAICNHSIYTVTIPAKTKRQFQEICRRNGLTRLYVYILFSFGIYALLSQLKNISRVTIDTEYPGKEKLIDRTIRAFFGNSNIDIKFARIGNKPKVHYAAHDVYTGKKKANKIISLEEILSKTKKTDGRLRECLSTLVSIQPRSKNEYYHYQTKKSRKQKHNQNAK